MRGLASPAPVAGCSLLRPSALDPTLEQVDLISIAFPNYSDGRGFSIARQLRNMGFAGRLRAHGINTGCDHAASFATVTPR